MPWPNWRSSSTKDESKPQDSLTSRAKDSLDSAGKRATDAAESIQKQTPSQLQLSTFAQPQTIVATLVLTTASLGLFKFYKSYLRRIPQAINIGPGFLGRRSLVGKVTSVGDGDNFRLYHTPGGRLAGWSWFPGRQVPTDKKALKDQTVIHTWTFAKDGGFDKCVRYMFASRALMRQSSLTSDALPSHTHKTRLTGSRHTSWADESAPTFTRQTNTAEWWERSMFGDGFCDVMLVCKC